MALRRANIFLLALLVLAACGNDPAGEPVGVNAVETQAVKPKLGLMTSLPLYWPLGADFGSLASGEAAVPWQRPVFERNHELVLLDTLTPIPGLSPDAPETDPLAGLQRLAIIQPRGLSPADNVALDQWVNAGGHLLLVLDPMLTGHYELALGDPRLPTLTALIPPVVGRWGLAVSYDEDQSFDGKVIDAPGGGEIRVVAHGLISADGPAASACRIGGAGVFARCEVGKGQVTILADAAVFEGHGNGDDHAGTGDADDDAGVVSGSHGIEIVLEFAFGERDTGKRGK